MAKVPFPRVNVGACSVLWKKMHSCSLTRNNFIPQLQVLVLVVAEIPEIPQQSSLNRLESTTLA